MNINQGEFVSILGPNGCGKSTLLRLVCGLSKPQGGQIKIKSEDISRLSQKELAKQIAFVPQSHQSIFPFSVNEIVMMGRTPYLNTFGFENGNDRLIVDEALSLMRVDHLKKKCINEISGGEVQRVYVARALAQKADILILDEPNAHLDLENQILIFNFLEKLNEEQNITVVAVSHDLNLVGIYSKNVVLMNQGRIIMEGKKSDILNSKNIAEIFRINATIFSTEDSKSFNVLINPIHD
jgi:iron complex transport system ATP-binding protein